MTSMKSIDILRTQRLRAERLRSEDLDELCRMHRDTVVMSTLGGVRSDDRTRQFLRDNLMHWERYGYGLWMFRDKAYGRFAGRGGLRRVHVGDNDEVELAYALMATFWGSGLATEMARAILAVAFERLAMADIVAFTLPANQASRRVMEKAGCRFERDIVHAGLPHVLYRIKREEYAAGVYKAAANVPLLKSKRRECDELFQDMDCGCEQAVEIRTEEEVVG